ncbi:MAG: integrase [Cytophagia bacterium]|nr:integrase [Cytophagia bacterium]NBW34788.1 integrase [Cytophagia bacterium]
MIDLFLRYLEFEKRLSKHTLIAYETDLLQFNAFLKNTYETEDPSQANYGMIRSWVAQLVEEKNEPRSVNRKIASLRAFFKYLLRQGTISKDPLLKIKVLKTQKRLPSFVREEEMNQLLDQVEFNDSFEGHRDKLIMELFYGSGMRLAELLQLSDKSINFKNRTLKVLGKRNKERVIPFSESLVQVIKDYQQARDKILAKSEHALLLVTDDGKPAYRMMVQRIVRKYLSTTSSDKKSPHVLRHTYATHLLNKGAEINAVKDLLGHSSLAATQVYTHNTMEKLKKTFEQAHPKA